MLDPDVVLRADQVTSLGTSTEMDTLPGRPRYGTRRPSGDNDMQKTILCAVLAISAAPVTPTSEGRAPQPGTVTTPGAVRNDDKSRSDIKIPSFLALLTHPELYDGAVVRVSAYMQYNYPAAHLYISRDDQAALGAFFGTILLSFRGAKIPLNYDELRRRSDLGYVIVEGRFTRSGPFDGTIDEIQRYAFALKEREKPE